MKKYVLFAGAPIVLAALLFSIVELSRWTSRLQAAEFPARTEAQGGFIWRVEIEGVPQTAFRGVEGLEATTEVIEVKDSANPNFLRKLPGRTSFGMIRLKFDPVPAGDALWEWYKNVVAEKAVKKDMSVILSTRDEKEVRRYKLSGAWPCKWEGPRQGGGSADEAMEEVTIAYERMERLRES